MSAGNTILFIFTKGSNLGPLFFKTGIRLLDYFLIQYYTIFIFLRYYILCWALACWNRYLQYSWVRRPRRPLFLGKIWYSRQYSHWFYFGEFVVFLYSGASHVRPLWRSNVRNSYWDWGCHGWNLKLFCH